MQDNISITTEMVTSRGQTRNKWILRQGDKFIIGAQSEQAIQHRKAVLDANAWKFIDCYDRGTPSPIEWIKHVRSKSWTFESFTCILCLEDGRAFFSGNIAEYSAAFQYMILDKDVLDQVIALAPEVPVERSKAADR